MVVKTKSWIDLWISVSSCVFSLFLFLKHLWKIFHSIHLLILLFGLDTIHIKESCTYLSHQLLFKTPHETLKFHEKSKTNPFSSNLQTYISEFFPSFSTMLLPAPQNHWTKQMVKKLNIWWNTAEDNSAWIKSWIGNHLYLHKTNLHSGPFLTRHY